MFQNKRLSIISITASVFFVLFLSNEASASWDGYENTIIQLLTASTDHEKLFNLQRLEQDAIGGNPDAANWLGVYFEKKKEYVQAAKWYKTAAEEGNIDAQDSLGGLYSSGKGVPKDSAQSNIWWNMSHTGRLKAANQGDAYSQVIIAGYFNMGSFISHDSQQRNQSIEWELKAANQGNASAQSGIAQYFARGEYVTQDDTRAAEWFRKAAAQGYAQAQYDLSIAYAKGKGVPQDDTQAAEWLRKAAEQGHPEAQESIGLAYADGKGVPQDDTQAVKWFRKAIDVMTTAQTSLGEAYANGKGVRKNNVIAYALFNFASAWVSSKNPAPSYRDSLISKMNKAEVVAGNALTQQMSSQGVSVALDAYLKSHEKQKS